jgi:hypothetical protein
MNIYIIYHIPNYKWKNGKIGKIGCTDNLLRRMKAQYATKYEILEIHSDIYIASQREIELQKQYGYQVDTIPYWKTLLNPTKEGRSKGGKKQVERLKNYHSDIEHQSMAGKIGGKKRAETMTFEERSYAGKKAGEKRGNELAIWVKESGHLKKIQKISAEKRKKAILQFDKKGNFIKEWNSIKECGDELGLHATSISCVCRGGNQKSCGGFIFRYKE